MTPVRMMSRINEQSQTGCFAGLATRFRFSASSTLLTKLSRENGFCRK
jgi:hypothetical protein